eukprot:8054884-Heterocapsa_arctica.AAC.1
MTSRGLRHRAFPHEEFTQFHHISITVSRRRRQTIARSTPIGCHDSTAPLQHKVWHHKFEIEVLSQ